MFKRHHDNKIDGNATIRRIDGLKNAGTYAQVSLVTSRLAAAQKSLTKLQSESFYDDVGAGANRLTGMRACCNETATTAYGGIQEDDLVSTDGTKVWEGKTTTTTEGISLAVIRTLCSAAKVRDGKNGKPDVLGTTETLFNVVADILQVQQRFTDASDVVKAGFTGLKFEGKEIFADDYIPSGYMFAFNSKYLGFAIHKEGYFMRTEWKVIPDSPEDKTLKLYWDGNLICSLRKAQIAHSNLS